MNSYLPLEEDTWTASIDMDLKKKKPQRFPTPSLPSWKQQRWKSVHFVVFELHLKQQFEIGVSKSYRFVLKMTKNVKLRMYKKFFFFCLQMSVTIMKGKWRQNKFKSCFLLLYQVWQAVDCQRELLHLFCASMLGPSVRQVLLFMPWAECVSGGESEGDKWLSEWGLIGMAGATCHYSVHQSSKWTHFRFCEHVRAKSSFF